MMNGGRPDRTDKIDVLVKISISEAASHSTSACKCMQLSAIRYAPVGIVWADLTTVRRWGRKFVSCDVLIPSSRKANSTAARFDANVGKNSGVLVFVRSFSERGTSVLNFRIVGRPYMVGADTSRRLLTLLAANKPNFITALY